jgi:transcription elongation factor GreB
MIAPSVTVPIHSRVILWVVNKAFTNEETARDPLVVPPRPPLPDGTPNYVTRRGLAALHAELRSWERECQRLETHDEADRGHALAVVHARMRELEERITSATLIDSHTLAHDQVRFGAQVVVRGVDDVERHYEIVGVDEADVAHGRLAFIAPLARALLGKRVGDAVTLRSPRGEEELEVVRMDYADDEPPT